MSKPLGRPKTGHGKNVAVSLTVPREIDSAVTALATATGTSRMGIMRHALLAGLAPLGLVSPELDTALSATPYSRNAR